MKNLKLTLALAAAGALPGAQLVAQAHVAPSGHASPQGHATPHWKYEGAEGPAHWGAMAPAWSACASGKEQSPIDLGGQVASRRGKIDERFTTSSFVFLNNGHTVQAALDRGSTLTLNGAPFRALQFHFHSPSEHTVKGRASAAELHLVHSTTTGELAVLGILIETSAKDNPALEPLIARLPLVAGDSVKFAQQTDIAALLDVKDGADETYYAYRGSLTTPPCTEGVQWIVRSRPINASTRQLGRLERVLGPSARPVQAVNARR